MLRLTTSVWLLPLALSRALLPTIEHEPPLPTPVAAAQAATEPGASVEPIAPSARVNVSTVAARVWIVGER